MQNTPYLMSTNSFFLTCPVHRFTVLNKPHDTCPPSHFEVTSLLLWGTHWPNHFSLCFKSKIENDNNTSTRSPLSSLLLLSPNDQLIDWPIGQPGRQHHLLPRSTPRHQALLHSYRRHHAPSSLCSFSSSSSSSICSPPHHTLTPPLHPYSGLSSRPYHLSKYQPLSK